MYDDMQGVNRSSCGRMLPCSLEPGNEARESEGNVSQSQIQILVRCSTTQRMSDRKPIFKAT